MGRPGRDTSHTSRPLRKHARGDVTFDDVTSDASETRSILTYLTRLLFLSIVLSCVVVFVVSILILAHCRRTVEPIEDLTGSSDGQCTSLGIPAYFACVILVIAVFGFGCVGRKVTGGLLVAVSALAMAAAIVVVVKQECGTEESYKDLLHTLFAILDECTVKVYSSKDYDNWLHSRELSNQKPEDFDCGDAFKNLDIVCPGHGFSPKSSHNQTEVESCVQHVSETLYSLCLKDGEITVPILLTLPIFYIGIGVGLVYITHVHASTSSKESRGPKCHSVSTNTDWDISPTKSSGPLGAMLCHKCLSWLCFRNSLCLNCALRGNDSRCCLPRSRPCTQSRLSFQMKQLSHEEDEEEAKGILRSHSPPEHVEDAHLVDEQANNSLVHDRIL